ncbi:MAG: hypothetical protein FRX49_11506 [Trebouxia sp. A1-2]|nr:MAG: hypothetical protein FRX49_11506 [Trebouxia sp. A1-2]
MAAYDCGAYTAAAYHTTNKDEKCDGYAFGAYTQCGGTTNCPAASCTCSDASWVWECLPDFTTNSPEIRQTKTRGVMGMLLVLTPNVVEALTALLLPAPALMLNATSAATTTTAGCSVTVAMYAQCGGKSNCPSGSNCADAQW